MSDNFNPFVPGADAREFALGLNQLRATDEAAKTRKLLEEQVRLQEEANELKKKELALEEAKLRQGQMGQQSNTNAQPNTNAQQNTNTRVSFGKGVECIFCKGSGHRDGSKCTWCNGTGRECGR